MDIFLALGSQTDAVERLLVATANRPQAPHRCPAGYDDSCSEGEFLPEEPRFEFALGHGGVDAHCTQRTLDVSQFVVRESDFYLLTVQDNAQECQDMRRAFHLRSNNLQWLLRDTAKESASQKSAQQELTKTI